MRLILLVKNEGSFSLALDDFSMPTSRYDYKVPTLEYGKIAK